jgi:hypothetical protein
MSVAVASGPTAFGDAGTGDREVHALMSRIREEKAENLKRAIETDVSEGRLPENTDAAGLACYVMVTLSGLVQRAKDGATRRELERVAAIAVAALPRPPRTRSDP